MKIGLVRHFEVSRGYPNKWVTGKELEQWVDEYNQSDVRIKTVDLGNIQWERCFSSHLQRAKITAQACYSGEITYLEELREVELYPLFTHEIKLPLILHLLCIRAAWICNHKSQLDSRAKVKERINSSIEKILAEKKDSLVVGHGGMMMFMSRELRKRGFRGPSLKKPKNGLLYVYENE